MVQEIAMSVCVAVLFYHDLATEKGKFPVQYVKIIQAALKNMTQSINIHKI